MPRLPGHRGRVSGTKTIGRGEALLADDYEGAAVVKTAGNRTHARKHMQATKRRRLCSYHALPLDKNAPGTYCMARFPFLSGSCWSLHCAPATQPPRKIELSLPTRIVNSQLAVGLFQVKPVGETSRHVKRLP